MGNEQIYVQQFLIFSVFNYTNLSVFMYRINNFHRILWSLGPVIGQSVVIIRNILASSSSLVYRAFVRIIN